METKRKHLFDLIRSNYFETVQIASINGTDVSTANTIGSTQKKKESKEEAVLVNPTKTDLTCRTCNLTGFSSVEEYRSHYKSNFHRFNLKLKSSGGSTLSQLEFEQLTTSGEVSDESSSDEDEDNNNENKTNDNDFENWLTQEWNLNEKKEESYDDEVNFKKTPKIIVSSNDISFILFRSILSTSQEKENEENMIHAIRNLGKNKKWSFFLCHGGHFSAAVFNCDKCIRHKSFHRYTVRKKQGGSQSSRDSKSATSRPKSAGATLRRFNEKRLIEDIRTLLTEWKNDIETSDLIFMFTPGANKFIFFYEDSILKKNDNRIRSIPLTVRRPNLVEINRVFQILTNIEFVNNSDLLKKIDQFVQMEDKVLKEEKKEGEEEGDKKSNDVPNSETNSLAVSKESEEEKNSETLMKDLDSNSLITHIKEDSSFLLKFRILTPLYYAVQFKKLDVVKYLLEERKVDVNEILFNWMNRTVLHKASEDGDDEIVLYLLEHNANPTIKGIDTKYAHDLAANKKVRSTFRKFAAKFPDFVNWKSIGIAPLTDDMEKEADEAKKQKKKAKKKAQAEKLKQKKAQDAAQIKAQKEKEEIDEISQNREKLMNKMSEREQRAYAAEIRIKQSKGQLETCTNCKTPLTTIPFTRFDNKFCSMTCLLSFKSTK